MRPQGFSPGFVFEKQKHVYNFQMQHRMKMFQTLAQKYAFAKKECINVHNKNKNLARENKMLKNMLMSSSRNIHHQPLLTSTPALTNDSSHMDNMSEVSSIPPYTPSVASRPGYAQRVQSIGRPMRGPQHSYQQQHVFGNASGGGSIFHRPSPVQLVPNGARNINVAAIHRPMGTAKSLQELQSGGKRT
ncbi:hypothetical protein JTB14_013781 [Gonioctena quinquepunctata]|nr:hypothetical protein JTB14_013781 [Gonioctena quinquepunctata]